MLDVSCERKQFKPIKITLLCWISYPDYLRRHLLRIPTIIYVHVFLYIPAQTIKFTVHVMVYATKNAVKAAASAPLNHC